MWGRLWGAGDVAVRTTPLCLLPRDELDTWLALSRAAQPRPEAPDLEPPLGGYAVAILAALDASGASFATEIVRRAKLLPSHFEMGLDATASATGS